MYAFLIKTLRKGEERGKVLQRDHVLVSSVQVLEAWDGWGWGGQDVGREGWKWVARGGKQRLIRGGMGRREGVAREG